LKVKLKPRTWILGAVCLGVILYVGIRASAESSDGYKFLDQTIRSAPQVQSRLGQIQAVKLSYLGRINLRAVGPVRAVGPDRWVTMTFNVVGKRGTATVVASAERKGGVWSVTASSIDGQPVGLN
jgi:Cytochrome oxidase complex assembly protein 1